MTKAELAASQRSKRAAEDPVDGDEDSSACSVESSDDEQQRREHTTAATRLQSPESSVTRDLQGDGGKPAPGQLGIAGQSGQVCRHVLSKAKGKLHCL
jgi:hypothetical protein